MSSLLTPRQRDLSSRGLRALTAGAAFVSAAATGGVTALAAQASAEDAAAKAADAAAHAKQRQAELDAWAAAHPVLVHVARPSRTVIGAPVFVVAAGPGVARVGGVPAARAPRSPASPAGTRPVSRPAPPAPPPPPAPSTGS